MNKRQTVANRRIVRNSEPVRPELPPLFPRRDLRPASEPGSIRGQCARPEGNESPPIGHTTFHGFSTANALKISRLPTNPGKIEKCENAERSEPNPGKLPGRAERAFLGIPEVRQRRKCDFSARRLFNPLPGAQPPQSRCRVFMRCARIHRQFAFRRGPHPERRFFKKSCFFQTNPIKLLNSKR